MALRRWACSAEAHKYNFDSLFMVFVKVCDQAIEFTVKGRLRTLFDKNLHFSFSTDGKTLPKKGCPRYQVNRL